MISPSPNWCWLALLALGCSGEAKNPADDTGASGDDTGETPSDDTATSADDSGRDSEADSEADSDPDSAPDSDLDSDLDSDPADSDTAPAGCGAPTRQHTVATPEGPAYADIADMDGDGQVDLVVASFGTFGGFSVPDGRVSIYRWAGDLSNWAEEVVFDEGAGLPFPNQPSARDMDGDGDLDILVPTGFFLCSFIAADHCGGLIWMEQDGAAWRRHDVIAPEQVLFYHHAELADLNADGIDDLVTAGEEMAGFASGTDRAVTEWYEGTGGGAFAATPHPIGAGLGAFPRLHDLDGDGDLDIASAEYFAEMDSFAWFEQTAPPDSANPDGTFVRHTLSADHGKAIQLHVVPDLYGDGVLRVVGSNHTNTAKWPPDAEESAVVVFTPGADPTQPWAGDTISAGIVSEVDLFAEMAAPGIFDVGDIDGDGDLDLLVAGDGDAHVYWFEQTAPEAWTQHTLMAGMRQTGGARIGDLDGDGCNDLVVTAYEDNAVIVFGR